MGKKSSVAHLQSLHAVESPAARHQYKAGTIVNKSSLMPGAGGGGGVRAGMNSLFLPQTQTASFETAKTLLPHTPFFRGYVRQKTSKPWDSHFYGFNGCSTAGNAKRW